MARIYEDNSLSIGNTPLIRLNRITAGLPATVVGKIEGRNPSYSVKCRLGAALIWDAEREGILTPGSKDVTIIEPTSWNKGKRHPTLEDDVVVGAGAKILGPITIGARTRVGANAVVVKSVPPDSVVVRIPGRVTHRKDTSRMIQYVNGSIHSLDLEHGSMPDMTGSALHHLADRISRLESMLAIPNISSAQEENWFYSI